MAFASLKKRRPIWSGSTDSCSNRTTQTFGLAERALDAIRKALRGLAFMPFSFHKAKHADPFLREIVIPFGASGYVALY